MSNNSLTLKSILIVVMDIALVGICLLVFALFHHVLPQASNPEAGATQIIITRPTATATVTPTPGDNSMPPDVTSTPYVDYGQFGERFADKFATDDTVTQTATEYRSKDIYISLSMHTTEFDRGQVVYHVADIYVRNIENFRTKLAHDTYGRGFTEDVRKMNFNEGGIVGLSGDMTSSTRGGIAIRNGVVYCSKTFGDVCVLYWDGTMVTYEEDRFSMDEAVAGGAYQAWDFGPKLLDDNGEPLEEFNSRVRLHNPRSVIGYYEPGHYCFVIIEGRIDRSTGATMAQTAEIMQRLGCKQAYNLDGGQSAIMAYNNGDGDWSNDFVNIPYNGGRPLTDMLFITEYTPEQ